MLHYSQQNCAKEGDHSVIGKYKLLSCWDHYLEIDLRTGSGFSMIPIKNYDFEVEEGE